MYYPVEMVLMVKAIVTFEGVGNYLKPGFDVASVSRSHINRLFLSQFKPPARRSVGGTTGHQQPRRARAEDGCHTFAADHRR